MGRNPPTCSKEISIAQAEAMHEQLRPMVHYLGKLVKRMEKRAAVSAQRPTANRHEGGLQCRAGFVLRDAQFDSANGSGAR